MSRGSLWNRQLERDPKLDAEAPEEPVRVRGRRKNTRAWCKGRPGRAHVPTTVIRHTYAGTDVECRELPANYFWTLVTGDTWRCVHAVRCMACGKYLNERLTRAECPTWQETQT